MNNQIVINDQLVSYQTFNNGGGERSVIFLHGWRSQKEVWNVVVGPLISQTDNKQLSYYAMDLPGFGASQKPLKDYGVGDYAEIVKGFIEKLDLKNIIIVGHSFGGRVGIKLASKYPELVKKLVLVDSAGFAGEEKKKTTYGLLAKIVRPIFKPVFMQGLRARIYKTIGAEDYIATPELQKTYVRVINEDLTEDMKQINCSTLIITGEKDLDTPIEFGRRMNSLIKNSNFAILSNAGHFSFLDSKQEFVNKLLDFIK